MKAQNDAAFDASYIRPSHCNRAAWRSQTPAQPGKTVMAHRRPESGKDEAGRKAAQQGADRMCDGFVARGNIIGLVEDCVGRVELANRRTALGGIALTKNTFEVALEQAIEIDCTCIHRSPSELDAMGKLSVIYPLWAREYRRSEPTKTLSDPALDSPILSCGWLGLVHSPPGRRGRSNELAEPTPEVNRIREPIRLRDLFE
jgi:hypothetical protein